MPAWLDWARAQVGTREVAGPKHNPKIIGWAQRVGAKVLGIKVVDDETAWCGLFAAAAIMATLPTEPLPRVAVRAKSWLAFGNPVGPLGPGPGAVLVFGREGGGHVGFYDAEDTTHFHVLGGNQGNAVSVVRIAKSRLLGARWPATGGVPTPPRLAGATTRPAASSNEA